MPSPIARIIDARTRDLGGGFMVRRILPVASQRALGPFVFLDEMGPTVLQPGHAMDVRPHPHINLATVTYLYEGRVEHRDSLGVVQVIEPGAVNWMTAGSGIAHSERTPAENRAAPLPVHGLQCWLALPTESEEQPPAFEHHPAHTLPVFSQPGVSGTVLLGEAFGLRSPAGVHSPTVYATAQVQAGATLRFERQPGHDIGAAVVKGSVRAPAGGAVPGADAVHGAGRMLVFAHDDDAIELVAETDTTLVLLGGAPLDGVRHIWWNFVSSRPERIEQAKADWAEGRFPKVPGEDDFIPLPEN
jgi:hypothetical protein